MEPIRFDQLLAQHTRGELLGEIDEALAELTEEVIGTGKPGVLTIQFKVEIVGKSGNAVAISATVAAKAPKPAAEAAIFFVGDHGSLHKDDPRSVRLPFEEKVDPETGEIRRVEDVPLRAVEDK